VDIGFAKKTCVNQKTKAFRDPVKSGKDCDNYATQKATPIRDWLVKRQRCHVCLPRRELRMEKGVRQVALLKITLYCTTYLRIINFTDMEKRPFKHLCVFADEWAIVRRSHRVASLHRKSQIANRKSQIANRKSQIANRKSQIASASLRGDVGHRGRRVIDTRQDYNHQGWL
jgi:hypothetical protein